jgi:hypothetical protein
MISTSKPSDAIKQCSSILTKAIDYSSKVTNSQFLISKADTTNRKIRCKTNMMTSTIKLRRFTTTENIHQTTTIDNNQATATAISRVTRSPHPLAALTVFARQPPVPMEFARRLLVEDIN